MFSFMDKSAIAEQAGNEDHHIHRDETKILQHASQTMELGSVRKTPKSLHFNRDDGYDIWMSFNWGRLVREAYAPLSRNVVLPFPKLHGTL